MLRLPPTSTLFPYTTLFRSYSATSPERRAGPPSGLPACPFRRRGASPRPRHRRADERCPPGAPGRSKEAAARSEEHTSELQSQSNLVCRLLLEKKKKKTTRI